MDKSELYVGQIVRLRAGKTNELVKVEKVNPKNVKVSTAMGTLYNAHPSFLREVSAAEIATFIRKPADEALVKGQIVRFVAPHMPQDLFVIIGQRNGGYQLAKLGGDKGRYYRGISQSQFEAVKFDVAGV